MDAKIVVFPWTLELPQSHWPFPYITYSGKRKPLRHTFVWEQPLLEAAAQVHPPVMPLNSRGWWWLFSGTWMFEQFLIPITDLLYSPGGLPPFLAPLFTAAELHFQVLPKDQDTAVVTKVEKTPWPAHQVRWQKQHYHNSLPTSLFSCFAAQNVIQKTKPTTTTKKTPTTPKTKQTTRKKKGGKMLLWARQNYSSPSLGRKGGVGWRSLYTDRASFWVLGCVFVSSLPQTCQEICRSLMSLKLFPLAQATRRWPHGLWRSIAVPQALSQPCWAPAHPLGTQHCLCKAPVGKENSLVLTRENEGGMRALWDAWGNWGRWKGFRSLFIYVLQQWEAGSLVLPEHWPWECSGWVWEQIITVLPD